VCRTIRISAENLPIIVIENPDHPFTDNTIPNVILSLPFTSRKLVNRIKPFVPAEGKNVLIAGPIKLDMERKHVACEDREAQLNPRLTNLLKTLMEHAGEVVLRETLFRQVWQTEYYGDTRTLDVHISWLRSAIEENPRKPNYLKTIRGVGYRLDIE
jgi:DNA-binding response OmpR family regulator